MGKGKKKKFKFHKRSKDSFIKEKDFKGSMRETIFNSLYQRFKPEGKIRNQKGRVLPPTWVEPSVADGGGHHSFALRIYAHYRIGGDGAQFVCLEQQNKYCEKVLDCTLLEFLEMNEIEHDITEIRCPMCQDIVKAYDKKFKGYEAYAKKLQPGDHPVVLYIDRKNHDEGPMIWQMPAKEIYSKIIIEVDELGGIVFIDDPEEGRDIKFDSLEEHGDDGKKRPAYDRLSLSSEKSLHKDSDTMDEWLEKVSAHSLVEAINWRSAEYIEKVFHPKVQDEEEEEDEWEEDNTEVYEDEVVEVETEDEEEEFEVDLDNVTQEYLNDLTEDQVVEVAKEAGVKDRKIKKYDNEQLIEEICEKLEVDYEEPDEEEDEEPEETALEKAKRKTAEKKAKDKAKDKSGRPRKK